MRKLKILAFVVIIVIATMSLFGCANYKKFNDKLNKFVLDDSWEIAFEDNFDTLDFTKWKTNKLENGIRRTAYYVDDPDILFTENGALTIRTKWKTGEYGEGFYTSWLESSTTKHEDFVDENNKESYKGFSSTYGYFEIKCKAPPAEGIWSAFWLMPDNATAFTNKDIANTGKDGAEIDIFESPFYSYKGQNSLIQSAIHCDSYEKGMLKSVGSDIYYVKNVYSEFHTYAVEWNEDEYIFYYDGYEIFRTNHFNGTSQVDEYIILSTEVGGENDGKKPTSYDHYSGNAIKNDLTKNYDFVIDYVKVYQKK